MASRAIFVARSKKIKSVQRANDMYRKVSKRRLDRAAMSFELAAFPLLGIEPRGSEMISLGV